MSYKRLAKRIAADQHNAQYEARKNWQRVEPLFRYIERLAMPGHALRAIARSRRAAERRYRVILAASIIDGVGYV